MSMTSLTIETEEDLKNQLELLFDNLGLNVNIGMNIIAKAAIIQGKVPFEIVADPFYNKYNQKYIKNIIDEYESGKTKPITKTLEELEALEND